MRPLPILLLSCIIAAGQEVVAPTPHRPGSPRGENVGGYNVLNSFETGYRFHTVSGSVDKYRSDVNFRNGLRLLSSSLAIHSREGQGRWFDELLVNTQGLGNDPYQFASVRAEKNRAYRYDLLWRENQYFNPALTIASGLHRLDTTRRLQDHTLVLFPERALRLLVGYARNTQSGPALTTANLDGSEFPLFQDVRRLQDEFRLGGELRLSGINLNITRAWETFRDDTRQFSGAVESIQSGDALSSFRRDQPMHGSTGHWRAYLRAGSNQRWEWNGRLTYAGGRQRFLFDEAYAPVQTGGAAAARQILVEGNARRPVLAANLAGTLFATSRLTLVNHTSFHHTRMDGDSTYRELDLGSADFVSVHFQFLGIRLASNTTDAELRLSDSARVFGGYHVAARRVRSIQEVDGARSQHSNTLHAGRFGLRLAPAKPFSLLLEGELGRTSRPFLPVSERDYHALGARLQYRSRALQASAAVRTNYNVNSTSLSNHSSRHRSYFADFSWSPTARAGIDLSYSKLHLDSLTGIAYFVTGFRRVDDRSWYASNIHSATAGLRLPLGSRADLFAGYSRVQDTGADRRRPVLLPVFFAAQEFPMSYESPLARVSVRLHPKLRWNAGYQLYRYRENLLRLQNYRAHTGYISLAWAF